MSTSGIDEQTLQAYRATAYRVHDQPPFTLRVGEASAALRLAHARHKVACSAFLTACNPFSEPLDEAANTARQAELAGVLEGRGLAFVHGLGEDRAGDWPGEASFLIFGLSRDAAEALGRQFDQNALLWNGADGVPQLILLR